MPTVVRTRKRGNAMPTEAQKKKGAGEKARAAVFQALVAILNILRPLPRGEQLMILHAQAAMLNVFIDGD
jgi:hypothetical protein